MEWADDDELYQHPQLSQKVWDAVDPTMAVVIETFEANGVDPADTITWAYELNAPDRGLSIGNRLESLRNSPEGQYAQPSVWEKLANRFQVKLDEIPEGEGSEYWVEALRESWERAGKVEKAIDCYLKYVSRIGNWLKVANYLNRHQLHDKAIEIAREGVKASRMSGGYGGDYYVQLQEPLAEAFSAKGDYLKATAIRAEVFLDRIGAYDEKRSIVQFNQVLDEAEKAGVREQVRKALIHALETGLNPTSIATLKFKPVKQEFDWKPVPKPVVYRIKTTSPETPTWPLSCANEGIRLFDSRWLDSKGFCQQDMEFLLKLAIVGGDNAEIARRFDDLPETPNNGGFPLESEKAEMCELVMAAMKGYRDDIVARLAKLRKYCYVREDRDGVECAVRVFRELGEASADAFPDWQTAMGAGG